MSIVNYLKENLESPKFLMGRSNVWYDSSKNGFETFFKVGPTTYSFFAEGGDQYEDGVYQIQFRKKVQGNTETIEDTKEITEAFIEAVSDWVTLTNPNSFFWIKSELYPSYNTIAEKLSKKLKEYYFIDESKENHDDQQFDVIAETPEETKYKRFIFTRTEPKAELSPQDWVERKLADNYETFSIYTTPEDIKPNPEHTSPLPKTGKLDKGVTYSEKKLK